MPKLWPTSSTSGSSETAGVCLDRVELVLARTFRVLRGDRDVELLGEVLHDRAVVRPVGRQGDHVQVTFLLGSRHEVRVGRVAGRRQMRHRRPVDGLLRGCTAADEPVADTATRPSVATTTTSTALSFFNATSQHLRGIFEPPNWQSGRNITGEGEVNMDTGPHRGDKCALISEQQMNARLSRSARTRDVRRSARQLRSGAQVLSLSAGRSRRASSPARFM